MQYYPAVQVRIKVVTLFMKNSIRLTYEVFGRLERKSFEISMKPLHTGLWSCCQNDDQTELRVPCTSERKEDNENVLTTQGPVVPVTNRVFSSNVRSAVKAFAFKSASSQPPVPVVLAIRNC